MNIAHIVYSFSFGGLERRIVRLIKGLTDYDARFTIVSLRPSTGEFLPQQDNVEHVVLDARPGLDVGAIYRLARLLKTREIDIVHSHNWVSMLEGVVAGNLARVPAIVHGEHGASRFEADQLRRRRTIAQTLLARGAHAIVPVNESIRDRIAELWHLNPERMTVIPNGVDTALFAPAVRPEAAEFVVGSISRLETIKNFPCLIKAISALNSHDDACRYRLVIVGDGSERSSLEALIAALNAEQFVSLPGSSDNPEHWYGQFDAYVNCSFSEGMSNTVLEAMACGCPVIATHVPGHLEWLKPDVHALFFENDDAHDLAMKIKRLADERELRTNMSEENRRYVVNEFSNDRFVASYLSLYRRLLGSG